MPPGDNSFLEMDTDAVSDLMARLAGAGRELDNGWRAALAGITGGEAAIGDDVIGQAIRGVYEPAGRALRSAAERLPPTMLGDADAGDQCVAGYLDADRRNLGLLGAPGGPDARS